MRGNKAVTPTVTLPSNANDLDRCLGNIVEGFTATQRKCVQPPVAISFAFPGPADYAAGIIGDCNNFPAFRGGVPLGPMLEDRFSLPVFITPPGAKSALGCTGRRSAADAIRVECENTGTAYTNPRGFVLENATGERLATRDSGGYILPGIKREFDIKRAEGPIPAGKAKLQVALDDGSTKTFDIQLAE